MTTEIEEQFFKCFGISNCNNCEHKEENYFSIDCCYLCEKYPEITAGKLLELICVLNDFEDVFPESTTIEDLKEEILKLCIEPFGSVISFEEMADVEKFHKAVRKLFEEEE